VRLSLRSSEDASRTSTRVAAARGPGRRSRRRRSLRRDLSVEEPRRLEPRRHRASGAAPFRRGKGAPEPSLSGRRDPLRKGHERMSTRALLVVEPGLLTTVQDLGRPGFASIGVPPSGALDRDALRLANLLLGNPENAAGLEVAWQGPLLEARG